MAGVAELEAAAKNLLKELEPLALRELHIFLEHQVKADLSDLVDKVDEVSGAAKAAVVPPAEEAVVEPPVEPRPPVDQPVPEPVHEPEAEAPAEPAE